MTAPSPEIPAALRSRAEQVLADYGHPHWWNDRRHGPWSSTAEAINASAEASELLRDASVALTGDPDALHETLAPGIDYAEAAWLVLCRPDAVAAWIAAARRFAQEGRS